MEVDVDSKHDSSGDNVRFIFCALLVVQPQFKFIISGVPCALMEMSALLRAINVEPPIAEAVFLSWQVSPWRSSIRTPICVSVAPAEKTCFM